MRKFLLICLIVLCTFSCSSDSDSNSSSTPVSRLNTSGAYGNRLYFFTYDDSNRISSVNCSASVSKTYAFTYDGNVISTMTVTAGSSIKTFIFTYADNKLVSFKEGGVDYPVSYNAENDIYSFRYGNQSAVFNYNAQGDLANRDGRMYFYDASKNGAIKSVRPNYYIVGLLADDVWLYAVTKNPMSAMDIPGGVQRDFESTYEEGEITKLVITEDGNPFITADYEY